MAAAPAFGHAVLLSASPSPNIGLGTPPERVTLRLSEPLRLPPSTIRVLDSNGKDRARSVRRLSSDPQSMEATVDRLERGVYRVEWRSVSVLDGHTIRGSYLFGVGDAPPGAPPASEAGPLSGPGIPGIVLRIAQDGALLVLLGAAGLILLARSSVARFAFAATRALPALAAAAFVATAATTLAEAVTAAGWSPSAWGAFLSGSPAAWGGTATLVLATAAFGAGLARRPAAVLVSSAGALAAIGMSGHAGATTKPAAYMAANAAHLVFTAVWLGGAAAIAAVWRQVRPHRVEIAALIARASPYAIGSAVLVGATGAVNALGQLAAFSDLWTTGYGRVVVGKVAALLIAAAFGARHSFVLRPRLEAAPANPGHEPVARGIRRALRVEAWTALAAVVLATVLVAFPDPPAAGERAEEQESTVPSIFAVRDRPFVTVAERDESLVIALTVAPPEPGLVELAVQLVPAGDISTEEWRVSVEATAPSDISMRTALQPCGPGCFLGRTVLRERGRWRFSVQAEEKQVAFEIPLPARDGSELLERLREVWGALRSVQIDEQFRGPGGFAIDTRYRYEAPNRSSRTDSVGRSEITIADRRYEQKRPSGPWETGRNPFPTRVPFPFPWVSATVEPRLLEDSTLRGSPVYTLALFDPFGIWYRIAVDKQTFRPLQDRMRAVGHFMDRSYSRFNEQMAIDAPE